MEDELDTLRSEGKCVWIANAAPQESGRGGKSN